MGNVQANHETVKSGLASQAKMRANQTSQLMHINLNKVHVNKQVRVSLDEQGLADLASAYSGEREHPF
ncbi:MAG: hypothetical protein IBX50_11900 [Marinospirillum sp.]|uniref:hypothetical protein n=1 Tax=Marinospirillum sp. TaxID=2183934 RepID=UPI0019F80852|nr:hypothetical protein [Marinospirillum sp.]MBE0507402.1 hypothetical protein [Marinospirillum sp.]